MTVRIHVAFCRLTLAFLVSAVTAQDPATFYVSPSGADYGPGTQESPFRTLTRARDAARARSPKHRWDLRDLVIELRGGTYRMDQPLVLDEQDSGRSGRDVVYRAASGEYPVVSGAVQVTGWTLHDAGLNIYRAYVGPRQTRQLYVNGARATRARTEDYPAAFLPFPITAIGPPYTVGGGILYEVTALNPAGWRDPSTWTNPQYIEAVILTQWRMMSVTLASVSPDPLLPGTGVLNVQQPGWKNANVFLDSDTNQPGVWSFWQVTRFENAYQFLDTAGEWYLDRTTGWLYYIPLAGQNMATAKVELPVLETLVEGNGELYRPVTNIRFEGLTFCHATWLRPSGADGYVSDQSGFHLVGTNHNSNIIGHDPDDVRTPGNVRFKYASKITFRGNIFENLGGVALDFNTGSQDNTIEDNLFTGISSAAIQLGGISADDHHPRYSQQITRNNVISNNLIRQTGVEFADSAAVYMGFTQNTVVKNNTIVDVPWAGIAVGWGWGLLDPGSYLGLAGATNNMWGTYTTPTPNRDNRILNNRMHSFLNVLWDGGAIYTTGQQGTGAANGLLISANVATAKRADGGGNVFYTDGGSRYITLRSNASIDNAVGEMYYGPSPQPGDPLPYDPLPSLSNGLPYGSDLGGCRTYGDIVYDANYLLQSPILQDEVGYNAQLNALLGFDPWSNRGFFNICPYTTNGVSYPTNLTYLNNITNFANSASVPASIRQGAGVQRRPSNIPASKWILPPAP